MNDLWILAGQSNMEGCGDLIDVEQPADSVRVFAHGDHWKTAEEPLHWLINAVDPVHHPDFEGEALAAQQRLERSTRTKGAGLGLSFAKELHKRTGASIDLLPVAHGGTSMEQWKPAHKAQGGKSLYGAMLRRVEAAMKSSPDSVIKGVLWYQGESECYADAVPVYTDGMIRLVGEMRSDLGNPDLPFYVVQLGRFSEAQPSLEPAAAWTSIREFQRLLPLSIKGVQVVPAIDLELDDAIHIGTQGLKRLARRLAAVALSNVYRKEAATPITLGSMAREGDLVRVSFTGVNGALRAADPAARVFGFGMMADGANDTTFFYKAVVDRAKPTDVLLYPRLPITGDMQLTYGYGLDPICQLTDEADMTPPAFGPLPLPVS